MELFDEFKGKMPSTDEIADEASLILAERKCLSPREIRKSFSSLITETEQKAYEIYLRYEKKIGDEILNKFISGYGGEKFEILNQFYMSIFQSRKARAGKTFESSIRGLFKTLDYPFEEQCVINGKPDFLLPSKKHYLKNAPDCIIFTAKRTVRERWRQIATEGVKGKGLFLATIDDAVTESAAIEMLQNRIYLVVPKSLKNKNEVYRKSLNIISFEDFLEDHMEPAMKRWKRNKTI